MSPKISLSFSQVFGTWNMLRALTLTDNGRIPTLSMRWPKNDIVVQWWIYDFDGFLTILYLVNLSKLCFKWFSCTSGEFAMTISCI